MRVLYLIDSLVPSGAERSLAALAPAYASRGVELEVAYLHDRPGLQEELRRAGIPPVCLAGSGGRWGGLRRAWELVAERRPRLVHTTLLESDLIGRLAARPSRTAVVSSLVNPQYGREHLSHPGFPAWKVRLGWAIDRATVRWVARFHAITAYIAEEMGQRLGIPPGRIEVIPRGRDPRALGARTSARRAEARRRLGIEDGEPLLLAVARQDRQKGLDVLLRAFAELRRETGAARLVIVGRRGNASDLLAREVADLGLGDAVRFAGQREDVPDLLCGADLMILPSRWEGLGSVLLEAMALEAPIVASDLPPVREVLQDGRHALLVPPERPGDLAAALARTLGDPEATRRRADAALTRFREEFTVDRVADRMVSFYGRALEEAR